jgi:RNA polymerase sigma-70 factor (ECF subfamily)
MMNEAEATQGKAGTTVTADVDASTLRAADQAGFARLTEPHRRALRAFCYRMLGSFADAEDVVQETLLRAWRGRDTFAGRASLRAWLHGIATHACLDFLAKNPRPALPEAAETPARSPAELAWLQPFPDQMLDPAAAGSPESRAVARESIGLAFMIAVQVLPARQRAALILCDVLDWSAKEAGELLELTVPAVNSALQRARATLRASQPARTEWRPGSDPDEQQRVLLERYVTATERGDVAGLAALLSEDVRFTMPPTPGTWDGRDNVVGGWVEGGFGTEAFSFRCLLTRANGTVAVANYLRKPGESRHRAMALDVLTFENGLVKEITTFALEGLVEAFGLPPEL